MSDKSFVTLVQHLCLSCGKVHDTGELAMRSTRDGRIRLEPTMDRYTVLGASPCPDCAARIAAGYIALVECDPSKTKKARDADGVERCSPRDVHHTGRSLWIRADSFRQVFKEDAMPAQSVAYIEPEVYEVLKAMHDRGQSGTAVQ